MVNLVLSGRSWVGWCAGGIINFVMYVLLFVCYLVIFLQMHLHNLFIYKHLFIFVDDWGGAE